MEKKRKELKRFEIKANKTEFAQVRITKSLDAYNVIKDFYFDDIEVFESFFILLCNRANNTIGYAKISQGGIVGTVVDIKLIAKYCVDSLASSVILAHNHPTGNLSPSQDDINITKKIREGLKLLDVVVLDHLILSNVGYKSLSDEFLI